VRTWQRLLVMGATFASPFAAMGAISLALNIGNMKSLADFETRVSLVALVVVGVGFFGALIFEGYLRYLQRKGRAEREARTQRQ
jgi:hypothetical protein